MIIGRWEIESSDGKESWSNGPYDYCLLNLDFTLKEMKRLEKKVGIVKADCTSWITVIVQATDETYQDCEIKLLSHFTSKELHNGQPKEYEIPASLFTDHAINYMLDFALDKLQEANGCDLFDIEEGDYEKLEWPMEYNFPQTMIDEKPIIVE